MDGMTHEHLCEATTPAAKRTHARQLAGIPRSTAAALNPLICDVGAQGTLHNVADLVEAVGSALVHDAAADDLAPQMWRVAMLAKSALLYEAAATH